MRSNVEATSCRLTFLYTDVQTASKELRLRSTSRQTSPLTSLPSRPFLLAFPSFIIRRLILATFSPLLPRHTPLSNSTTSSPLPSSAHHMLSNSFRAPRTAQSSAGIEDSTSCRAGMDTRGSYLLARRLAEEPEREC